MEQKYDIIKKEYTYGICDGEYLLKNYFNMLVRDIKEKSPNNPKKWKLVDTSQLFSGFLSMIFRLKYERNIKFMILCFDKSPYYTKTAIENYKADRYNASERLEEIQEQLESEELTEEERRQLLLEQSIAIYDEKNFWEYQKVKKSFLENKKWERAGVHSIWRRGYEADMIAYYLVSKIAEINKKDPFITANLVTADKDWKWFEQNGIVYVSTWMNKNLVYENYDLEFYDFNRMYKKYCKFQKDTKKYKKITKYEYGILRELFIESHNNATLYQEMNDGYFDNLMEKYIEKLDLGRRNGKPKAKLMALSEIFFRIINKCPTKEFKSYKIMRKAYKALNLWLGKTVDNGYCQNIGIKYTDDLNDLIMQTLKNCNKYEKDAIKGLIKEYGIMLNFANYNRYLSTMKCVKFMNL